MTVTADDMARYIQAPSVDILTQRGWDLPRLIDYLIGLIETLNYFKDLSTTPKEIVPVVRELKDLIQLFLGMHGAMPAQQHVVTGAVDHRHTHQLSPETQAKLAEIYEGDETLELCLEKDDVIFALPGDFASEDNSNDDGDL